MALALKVERDESIDLHLPDGSAIVLIHRKRKNRSGFYVVLEMDPAVAVTRRKISPTYTPAHVLEEDQTFAGPEPLPEVAATPAVIDNRPLGRRLSTIKPWERKGAGHGVAG